MAKRNILEKRDLLSAWKMVQRIPVELRQVDIESALEIALEFNIYAYDAYFLECAVSSRGTLLTLDRSIQRVAADIGIPILETMP